MSPATALALLEFDSAGVATGHRLVDPERPILRVTELAATRGDGIFETIGLFAARPIKLERHLDRMQRSARMLDFPTQDLSVWANAVHAVAEAMGPVDESFVKLVLSRGVEGSGIPTGWAYGEQHPSYEATRATGLRVVLLDRGYRQDVARTSPWLLQGAKTISYAINRASLREAQRRGADDVVFVSSDGFLLEGPTSTLVLRHGHRLRTPRSDLGILVGTTQAELFEWAVDEGYECSSGLLTADDLVSADAAWLVSSLRLAAPIRAVDGIEKAVDATLTASFTAHLRALAV